MTEWPWNGQRPRPEPEHSSTCIHTSNQQIPVLVKLSVSAKRRKSVLPLETKSFCEARSSLGPAAAGHGPRTRAEDRGCGPGGAGRAPGAAREPEAARWSRERRGAGTTGRRPPGGGADAEAEASTEDHAGAGGDVAGAEGTGEPKSPWGAGPNRGLQATHMRK